jgi:hypothetical protein
MLAIECAMYMDMSHRIKEITANEPDMPASRLLEILEQRAAEMRAKLYEQGNPK